MTIGNKIESNRTRFLYKQFTKGFEILPSKK